MTQTLTADLMFDTNSGSEGNWIIIQGYSSTPGDGVHALIDGDSSYNVQFSNRAYIIMKDMDVTNTDDDGISVWSGSNYIFESIKISNAGDMGLYDQSTADNINFINCDITSTDDGMQTRGYASLAAWNYIHDISGGDGIESDSNTVHMFNVIDTVSDNGIKFTHDDARAFYNTIYNAGDDSIYLTASDNDAYIIGNLMDTAVNENLDADAVVALYGYNTLYGNGGTSKSGTIIIDLGGEQTGDPSLDTTSFQASGVDDLGYPTYYDDASGGIDVPSHLEIGAVMYEESGAGSTVIIVEED